MDTIYSRNRKFNRMLANILSIVVILAMAFPVTTVAYAAPPSPFLGQWYATDTDGSDMVLSIAGRQTGPFQITWTDDYISYCNGESGIVRGTGWPNESNSDFLESDVRLACFRSGATLYFHVTFRYHSTTDTLSVKWIFGQVTIWHRPGKPQMPPALNLRVNYGDNWVESFYEDGHTAWVTVTESDGVTVKATAELMTEPKDYWGGETGFQTNDSAWFDADGIQMENPPDIRPYDWVFGWVDNGASAQVQIGEIRGVVDVLTDSIAGTINTPWFSNEVQVECHPWGAPEPTDMKSAMVLPDGTDPYSCSWVSEWDIQPGAPVGVGYFGEDGHWVANVFRNPRFDVFPEWNAVEGWEWPEGKTITATVAEKAACTAEGVAGYPNDNPWSTYARIDFPVGCDIAAGDIVTLNDGTTTLSHTIRNLAITRVDASADTVTGTAEAGAQLYVWAHGYYENQVQPTGGEDGTWLADFGSIEFDLVEGMCGRSEIRDELGNATSVDWCIPNPHFSAFPEWEYIEGWEWPLGANIHLSIDDPATEANPDFEQDQPVVVTPWDPNGIWVSLNFRGQYDMKAGDVVTLSDGVTSRTHTIQNLAITGVDQEANTVAGTADPGAQVHVWAHGYNELMPTTDEGGNWSADFNSIDIDLVEGMGGRTEIRDEFGNATAVEWRIPYPRFVVFPESEWFDGNDWPDGATVNITVEGKPECAVTKVSWGDFFNGSFGEGCDVVVGDTVTFTDGETVRTHTVRNLAITEVNKTADTVSGTADAGEVVYAWVHGFGETETQLTVEDGTWLADFGSRDFDLVEGTCGRSEIRDEAGNSTAVDWCVPNPRFSVFPEWNYIEGWEWPDGAIVYATIEGKPLCSVEGIAGYPEWDPITFVPMWFPEGCDAIVGDVVTLTDNVTTRQHTIQNLAVTGVDAANNTVSGTADAGVQVHVWPHGYNELLPTADANGNWTADFTETGLDLVGGMAGRTEVRDEMGNATAVEWGVPGTIFVTGTEDVIVNDGVCTLREAVIAATTNAPSGEAIGECPAGSEFATDTILLAANQTYSLTINGSDEDGAYTGDLDILDNSAATDLIIMVEGNGNATISQDASVDDRVLEIRGATVQIEGLTLTGGSNVEIGGGVHNAGGMLIMNGSTVSGNTANYGGGIYNGSSGTLILAGSTVSGNTANVDGGGLENGGTLTVDASTISANSATYGGGALFTYVGTVTIQNGSVIGGDASTGQGNTANYGGGIAVWSGSLSLTNSMVSGNTVSWVGGGIRNVIAGRVTVSDSTISGNSAAYDGGGLQNEGTMTLYASEVGDNTSTYQGGGIGNYEGNLTITASTISGNSSGDGGGVTNWPNSTLVIDGSTFTSNTAGGGGGLANKGTATIENESQFIGNTVSWVGGGISNVSGGVLVVEGSSVISGNSSDGFGGGLYNDQASTLTVSDSKIASNVSVYGGGGIMNEGMLTVDHSVLSANSSSLSGGAGGALDNTGTATIRNGTLIGGPEAEDANLADGGGGLFSLGTLTVNDSIVTGNRANYGGGLFNWIGGILTINNSTVSNNSANEGGGLHNKEDSTAVIQNSVFSGNYAEWSAGGIDNWGTITITGSVLRENYTPGEAGDAIASGVFENSAANITGSCIVGNGDTAVFTNPPVPLNATGNWWGDASGPSGAGLGSGDSVSDFVDFSDWLLEPPAICLP